MNSVDEQPKVPQNLIRKIINSFPFPIIFFSDNSVTNISNDSADKLFREDNLEEIKKISIDKNETTKFKGYKLLPITLDEFDYTGLIFIEDIPSKEKELKRSAHDLNNILTSINNSIDLLQRKTQEQEDLTIMLNTLKTNVVRASELIEIMLSKDHSHSTKFNRIKIEDLFTAVSDTVKQIIPDQINYKVQIENDLDYIYGNFTLLYRALLNLIVNAKESIAGIGSIEVEAKSSDDKSTRIHIVIRDTGIGIDKENLSKIFESDFSTKIKSKESGFGLSTVKEIIERHMGAITVSSNINEGTTFNIYLPAAVENERNSKGHECKILIAEDNQVILEELCELFKFENYDTVRASNGIEVLDKLEKDELINLVIIDKKMPLMDGIECIAKIRKKNNEIKIILASGSTSPDYQKDYEHLSIDRFVMKPYNIDELLKIVQELF
ncbi:MAG: hybrid sensor histidine kinase/response regulator [Melioribacteraceae bacterium]|nr:hybrid sensor histidine kinase/response regulator [Melioribacteraceae bacterium]